jgi:ribosomal protein S18 acetylase RimI-like enzyme
MNAVSDLGINRSAAAEVAVHMRACDQAFVPPLSTRVDIDTYASKIAIHAQRFEAWENGVLTGLVAAYCNDPEKDTAFVSSVSVLPQCQGRGIASALLAQCITHVRSLDFLRLKLEVDDGNRGALDLYARHGFLTVGRSGTSHIMTLTMKQENR